jgi:hypothetical protein
MEIRLDSEAVACDGSGRAVFLILRKRKDDASVFLYAFDPLQLGTMSARASRGLQGCA